MQLDALAVRSARVIFGVLALYVVIGQLLVNRDEVAGFSAVNYFSYFTIESNILAGVLLTIYGLSTDIARRGDLARGAVALYIVVTGIIYNVLLRGVPVDTSNEWFNEVLHVVIPLVALLDWIFVPPTRAISRRQALIFLVYPLSYLGYSLIRGPIVDWYPYPFVDPRLSGGYGRVVIYVVALAVAMALLAMGIAELGRFSARRQDERRIGRGAMRQSGA